MRIAVNAGCFAGTDTDAVHYGAALLESLGQLHPEHTFILLSQQPLPAHYPANVPVYVLGLPFRHHPAFRWRRERKVKSVLKKINADVLVSLDGNGLLSSKLPQVIGIPGPGMMEAKGSLFAKWLYDKRMNRLVRKATAIITTSAILQQNIEKRYPAAMGKTSVVPVAADDGYGPVSFEEKERIKTTYTDGKEFFLFTGGFDPSQQLMQVLKAFSQFKKWQQSNMKLVITGDMLQDPEGMAGKLASFRFRDDVVMPGSMPGEDYKALLASAYALLLIPGRETAGLHAARALRSGTPVICTPFVPVEVTGEVVLHTDGSEKDTAAQMIRLYQDEALRSQLAEQGLARAASLTWSDSAEKLWRVIETVAGK